MVTRLLPQVGFPWVMRTCAFLFLFLLIIAIFTVEARTPPKPKPWELAAFFRPLRERAFLLNTIGLFCFSWGLFVPFNFLVLEAQYQGVSAELANYQIAILNGARSALSFFSTHLSRFSLSPRLKLTPRLHKPLSLILSLQHRRPRNPRLARRPLWPL